MVSMNPFSNLSSRDKVLWGAVLVWTGLVFHHYFSLKTAFDLSFLLTIFSTASQAGFDKLVENWLGFLGHLLCATAASFVLWRLGRKLFLWIGLEEKSAALRFCLEMGFGIILANTLWLGLGLNGLWFESLLWLAALALLAWALWDFSRSFLKIQKFPRVPRPGKFFIFLGLLGAVGFALDILRGVTPDVYFDALVYHLSTLQFWQFHHGIADFYTNLYSYFPFGGELYFADGFFFSGTEAAKMLNAFSAGLCGLAAAGWVAGEAGWDKGIMAWTMVLTLPLVSATVWTTQNDVVLAFFLVLFLYALVRWAQGTGKGPWVLAAGLLGGALLTIKYTAVVSVGVALLVTASSFNKGSFQPAKRKGWALIVLMMTFSVAPWLVKNWVFTGNGFYPYLSSLFGGRTLPDENMKALLNDNEAALGGSFSLWNWISRVTARDLDKTIAPLLFAFVPLLFIGGKRRPVAWFCMVLSMLLLLSGFLISHQIRLMIPAFVICFMAMAMVLADSGKKGGAHVWGGIVALFGVLSLLLLGRLAVNYYQIQEMACGAQTREEYLASIPQTSSYYGLVQAAGKLLPPDARILVVGDARGLYYPRSFYANSVFDDQVLPRLVLQEKGEPDGIRKRLREMGIDAIVVSGTEGRRLAKQYYSYSSGGRALLGEFVQRWTDPIFVDNDELNGIYTLRATPAGFRKPIPILFWE